MPLFVLAPAAISKLPMQAIFVEISLEFIAMLIILAVILTEFEPRLIMFVKILSEFALIAMVTEVRSVVPPPAPAAIAAEFVLIPLVLVEIALEFVLMFKMLVDKPAELVLILIMFADILSEFVLIAIMTEVKSVGLPPAPDAIELEFVLIPAEFVEMFYEFA